uniref:C2H2-type domain-containing protein n=1 Tax=viral metagenome TaxID=1070528 RepID=A0A6C0EU88_9ZZZZ
MSLICKCCDYKTSNQSNFNKHLKTAKHAENEKKIDDKPFSCKYCGQKYKFKQSISKHIKYSCTKNKDEDLKELVRLLNNQIDQQKADFQNQIQNQHSQIQTQSKQIERLMGKLEINMNTTNIQNNITLLSYKDTDVSHLTKEDYKKCIKKVCFCVMGLIEKVHFNPEKPENMNIYISNMKDKYLMVYDNGNWNLKNKISELDRLYDDKELMIEEWIEENKDKEMEHFFKKYLNLKKDNKTIEMINDEIKLMMYNKKKMIE